MKLIRHTIATVLGGMGLLATLSLGAALQAPTASTAASWTPLFPPGTIRLYRATASLQALQRLRGSSLTDLGDSRLRIGARTSGQSPVVVPSADGLWFAVLTRTSTAHWPIRASDMTLQLFSGQTGRPLASAHHPAVPLIAEGISIDGSRIYGVRADLDWNAACSTTRVYVLDTLTGSVLRVISLAARPWDPILVAPNLGRAYSVTGSDYLQSCAHVTGRTAILTAYDVQSGHAIRAVRVPGMLDGSWKTGGTVNGEPVIASWTPGVALSPDGRQIALLDGQSDTLILLDAATLRVTATRTVSQPSSILQTAAATLGLVPDVAQAKGQESGTALQMQYTASGQSLIVTGARVEPNKHHFYSSSHPLGMREIDVATGRVRGKLQENRQIIGVWPAPDGRAVYSTIQEWSRTSHWTTVVRRHDPVTLQITATRAFHHTDNWSLSLYFLRS